MTPNVAADDAPAAATIVAAPKQRKTIEVKKAIKAGRIPDGWEQNPARLAQKDRDAH